VHARFVALASGLRVRVVEAGDERAPPIVLVPGWGCGAWIFHETLGGLALAGFRAIAVELKGHGLSDKPRDPGEYTLESMSAHLLQILDALGLERPGIIGHSMGAAIAAHLAAANPERVERLVMVAPVGFRGVPGMALFRALTPEFAIRVLPFLATRGLVRLMLRVVYGSLGHPTERDVDEFRGPTSAPDFTRALRHLLHEFTWEAPFPKLRIPLMTIVGTEDHLSAPGDISFYGNANGSGETMVIEGAGHVILPEAPGVVNSAMAEFFKGGSPPYIAST
jgi:pimeloyl-ACP methyl ester carboxylesterase